MAQAKLDKNFANYFLIKKQVKNKFFLVLKCTCKRATEKHKWVKTVKSKSTLS